MPDRSDPFTTALIYVTRKKVIQTGPSTYEIKTLAGGEHIFFDRTKVSCTCTYYTIHGIKHGRLCAHIMAVIIYRSIKALWSWIRQ